MGVLEEAVGMAFVHGGMGRPERAGKQPDHGVDDHNRGDLTRRQNVITDRDLAIDRAASNSLIDPLVVAAHQEEARNGCEFGDDALRQDFALRAYQDPHRRNWAISRDLTDRRDQWTRGHDHARAAAIRLVVGAAASVKRPIAKVMYVQVSDTC